MLLKNITPYLLGFILFLIQALIACTPKNNSDQTPVTNDISTKLDLTVSPTSGSSYAEDGIITITTTLTPQTMGTPPSGLVVFTVDGTQTCGDGVHLSNDNGLLQAICLIYMKDITAGEHPISAQYMGEPGYAKSNQQTLTYNANPKLKSAALLPCNS